MNTKVKIALIIIMTLVLGIVLGAMLNRAFIRYRIRRAFADRNPVGMVAFMEKNIQPTPDQREQIREILERHRIKTEEIREKFMEEMRQEFESLDAELDPILTPEQKKRLKRRFFRPRDDRRHRPDRPDPWRMPPPPGKPPKPPKEPIK
jgi:Spy/CpxP family protein refolding chaperone